jgi:DNA-directed RNA polymerase subunit RPC12/RpoP
LSSDISHIVVEYKCPKCSWPIEVLLKQFIAEEIVICPNCFIDIQLVDKDGSCGRAQKDIDGALDGFGRKIERIGRH